MKKSVYKNMLKKHTPEELLNMYRDSKIEFTTKEWNDLHKLINKKNHIVYGIELKSIIHTLVGLVIITIIAFNFKSTNFELIKKCNEIQGHTCSRYEIQRMVANYEI